MKTDAEKIELIKRYVADLADWMRRRAERDSPAKADTPEQAYKQCAYRLDQFVVAINNGEFWPNAQASATGSQEVKHEA